MRRIIDKSSVIDLVAAPLTYICARLLLSIRKQNIEKMKISKKIFNKVGIFPIRDHYYEPFFNPKHLIKSLRENRSLEGIDFNVEEQLELLNKFDYKAELLSIPLNKQSEDKFYYLNDTFTVGDAEYLYNIIRYFKPSKIIEIGSGNSTLMAKNAISKNMNENSFYNCGHVCIEPFEADWLEKANVTVVRERVELLDKSIFMELDRNDILFIDSSHIIRPQGDVLFEYLEILPLLKPGVLVHIHDIFSPKDYLDEWIYQRCTFWNEQYLLEAFLSFNNEYKVIGSLNYLYHNHYDNFLKQCPFAEISNAMEPRSFWIMRR